MNTLRQFQVRKYSTQNSKMWEHFPSRNDIVLLVTNNRVLKVIWKTSVLQEFDIENVTGLQVFARSPSMGFKFTYPSSTKFQVGFTTNEEYAHCLAYLSSRGLAVMDTDVVQSVFPDDVRPPPPPQPLMGSQLQHAYATQLSQPMIPQSTNVALPRPSVHQQISQSLNQMTQPQMLIPEVSNSPEELEFLSQILPPPPVEHRVEEVGIINKEPLDLSDVELKNLIKERIKDPKFIEFVNRVEEVLNQLNKK